MDRPQLPRFHDGDISLSYSQPYISIERSDICSKSLPGLEKFEMLMRACAICTTQRSGVERFTVISTNPQGDFLSDFGLKKRVSSEISKPDRFQTIRDMKK